MEGLTLITVPGVHQRIPSGPKLPPMSRERESAFTTKTTKNTKRIQVLFILAL
jgi:hypothetical protein